VEDDDWKIKREELGQLAIHSSELLKDDPMGDYVENICNIYLQHHSLEMDIWGCSNTMHHDVTTPFNHNVKLMK
jgi:hypothetical protein